MKNYLLKSITLFLLLFISVSIMAQDKIYTTNKDVVLCKITEIGEDEVKYTTDETGDLVYALDKDKIEKIVLENGKELVFQDKMTDPELYTDNSKNAWKLGLFSPLTGALSAGYERSIKPGQSVEGSVGIIGLGISEALNYNQKGACFKAGYKFIMTPDYILKGMKYSHLLKGWYFRPDINLAVYNRDFEYYDYLNNTYVSSRGEVIAGAITLSFGKQWVLSNVFLVDIYGGLGYGFDTYNTNGPSGSEYYDDGGYHYGFVVTPDIPLSFTAGFKVGFLTK